MKIHWKCSNTLKFVRYSIYLVFSTVSGEKRFRNFTIFMSTTIFPSIRKPTIVVASSTQWNFCGDGINFTNMIYRFMCSDIFLHLALMFTIDQRFLDWYLSSVVVSSCLWRQMNSCIFRFELKWVWLVSIYRKLVH